MPKSLDSLGKLNILVHFNTGGMSEDGIELRLPTWGRVGRNNVQQDISDHSLGEAALLLTSPPPFPAPPLHL